MSHHAFPGAARLRGVFAARAGRVGFGAVLIAGALAAGRGAFHGGTVLGLHLAPWFGVVWAAAFVTGLVTWAVARGLGERRVELLRDAGVVVPAIGLALMTPLTIHLPIMVNAEGVRTFDDWVALSVPITGFAHATLAWLSARRVRHLVRGEPADRIGSILGYVIVVSMIPFMVLYLIPPLIVAMTGFAYIPCLYLQGRIAEREHALIAPVPPTALALALR